MQPTNASAYSQRAGAYSDMRRFEEAISDYDRAISIDPNMDQFYVGRGLAYDSQGKLDRAIEDYTKALSVHPTVYPAGFIYEMRAFCFFEKKDAQSAYQDLLKAKKLGQEVDADLFRRAKETVEIDAELEQIKDEKARLELNQSRQALGEAIAKAAQDFSKDFSAQQRQKEMIRYQAEQQAYYNNVYNPSGSKFSSQNFTMPKRYKVRYNSDGSEATVQEQW